MAKTDKVSKYTVIGKQGADEISEGMLDLLKPIAEKFGLSISMAGGSYSDFEATLKFRVKVNSKEAKADAAKKADSLMKSLGIKKKVVSYMGRKFEFVGFKPKATKFPYKARDLKNGKVYGLPAKAFGLPY